MKIQFTKKKACKQCPFAKKLKGYIGPYKNPSELHDLVKRDVMFPCHKTEDSASPQMCAGYVQYQKKTCQQSRIKDVRELATQIVVEPDNLGSISGDLICEFHSA